MMHIKKKCIIYFLSAICFLQLHTKSFGQASIKSQGTAVPFLLISPDARSGGMGNLSLGMSPEANDLFGNTSKIPLLNNKQGFLINYTPWLKDIGLNDVYLASAGYYRQLNENSSINSSLRFFSIGEITLTNDFGDVYMNTKPSEFSYDFGYSLLLNDKLSMGVTLRYINSRLLTGSTLGGSTNYRAGNTLAGDISIFYKQKENLEGFHAGLLLSNLGGKISYSSSNLEKNFIPASIGLGLGYLSKLDADNSLEFGLDLNRLLVPRSLNEQDEYWLGKYDEWKGEYYSQSVVSSWFNSFGNKYGMPLSESIKASLGFEYNYTDRFYFRGGYFYDTNKSQTNMRYFTFGASFQYQQSKFNLSYLIPSGGGLTKNPLSNTIRFGSIFYF